MPTEDDAGVLWDHVVGLATVPGFAELKRSLRERPQLASFGVESQASASRRTGTAGVVAPRNDASTRGVPALHGLIHLLVAQRVYG
jgi:hypothetical protein